MRPSPGRRRAGFTLIELLVAIGLAIVITALTVAVLNSGAIESHRVVQSADRVSGWLITAKNRAKRDGKPRGVRFFRTLSPGDTNLMSEAQYIELPDPIVPNPLRDSAAGRIAFLYTVDPTSRIVTSRKAYYVSSNATDLNLLTPSSSAAIGKDDFVVLPDFGRNFRIIQTVGSATTIPFPLPGGTAVTLNAVELMLAGYPDLGAGFAGDSSSGATSAAYFTYNFAFQGSARPLFGEPVLQLGSDAMIDARARGTTTPGNTDRTSLNVTTTGDFDVLFAPSGQVLGQTVGLLAFWVRDPRRTTNDPITDIDNAGEQILVVVYTKTGAVSTQPVVSNADPYQAAKTGINAGF